MHEVIRPNFNAQEQHLKTVQLDDKIQKENNKIFFSKKLFAHIEHENKKKKIDVIFQLFL